MSVIRGWDQSFGRADAATAAKLGFQVVAGYLSHDPGKNLTVADVRDYHRHGIGVILNWESQPGRPLLGAAAGDEDAADARRQLIALVHEVGHTPRNTLGIYFSCDREVHGHWGPIDAYYANTKRVLGGQFKNGCYGDFDLVNHLHAKGLTVCEWQTLAWSYGRVSPEADFYQRSINDTLGGASVDFDTVYHPELLGAWWPAGHKYDVPDHPKPTPAPKPAPVPTPKPTPAPAPPTPPTEDDMLLIEVDPADCAPHVKNGPTWPGVWLLGGDVYAHVAKPADAERLKDAGVKQVVQSYATHENLANPNGRALTNSAVEHPAARHLATPVPAAPLGDYLTSAIRTGVPLLIGWLVSWLLARGINVPAETREWAVSGLTFAAALGYYLIVRALELKWPRLGRLLGVPTKPVYTPAGD